MRRVLGVIILVLGVLLSGGAAVVHWVVAPRMSQLPGNTSITRLYSGTAAIVANPSVPTGIPLGPGLMRNVPVTVRHDTVVIGTRGHDALVHDRRIVTVPGYTLANLRSNFDVDRRTFLPGHKYPNATHAEGLTFNWPLNTQRQDYRGWVSDTGRTVGLHYVATVRHGGIETYMYTAHASAAPIVDPQLLKLLPSSSTQKALMQTTPSLQFSTPHLLKLSAALAKAPNRVPLAYTYAFDARFWIAPRTGVVVDHRQHDLRSLFLVIRGKHIPVAPVMDMRYAYLPASVAAAASDAKSGASQLRLVNTTLPWGLLIGGAVLIVVGLVLLLVPRRRRSRSSVAVPEQRESLDSILDPERPDAEVR